MTFAIATSIQDALVALSGGARPIAGGSDLVVAARHGKTALPHDLVAIDRLAELVHIDSSASGLTIGALTSHAALIASDVVCRDDSALADASALVGSPATRNVGTLGGNVMNASPAMDTGAPLLVFDASVELRSVNASRTVAIADLWTGPGTTVASPEELCVAITVPARPANSGSAYVRLEYRRAMEIAVVGAAANVVLDGDGGIASISVALTAVAPTIIAVRDLQAAVHGRPVDATTLATVAELAAAQASPISDVRASDAYRRHCVGVMARRAVEAAARRATGETIAVPVNRAVGIGAAR